MEEIEAVGIVSMRTCQDKIRLFERDVAGVINNKQPGDSKYTVVWSYQTNDGKQNGFKENQGSKTTSNIVGIFYFTGDSGGWV